LVRASIARPVLTIAVCLALGIISSLYTARTLKFETSSVQLLPPHHLYVQRFKENLRNFGELNDIVVVVEAPHVERAKAYADRLAAEIRRLPGAGRVAYRVDPSLFTGQALLYLSTDRLAELHDKLVEHRRFIERYATQPTLAGLLDGVSEEIARRFALGFIDLDLGLDDGGTKRLDPGFVDTLLGIIAEGMDGPLPPSPWQRVFTSAGDEERSGYFLSADDKLLFILVEARREAANFTDNEQFIAAIRHAIGALHTEFADVAAGVTGTPALSNDEMLTAFRDSTAATLLAFALTLGFLILVFRRVVAPFVMLGVLMVSLAWSLGIISATVGHLTVFSVMFISLLIGIGIDYGIYVFFRYEEELGLGRTPQRALEITASQTGPGVLFGALTAAGTFGVLALTEFRGIQEFGVIAGTAILISFVSMVTFFPALVVVMQRHARWRIDRSASAARSTRDGVPALARLARYPVPILLVAALLTAGSLAGIPALRFDYNRLNLQARGTESVRWERRIMESRRSGFAALTTARSLAELRQKQDDFSRLPTVSEVVSVLKLIPADQDVKIATIHDFAPLVSGLHFGSQSGVDAAAIQRALESLHQRLALGAREADPGPTAETLASARDRAEALLARLRGAGPEVMRRLGQVQTVLRDDFIAKLDRLKENLAPRPVTIEELPAELKRKFIGADGRLLMQIYPAINTWERDGARVFVNELRTVDPGVTGSPVISYEASRLMETAYVHGTLYAALLVAALAAVVLRRVLDVLLALTPLALGTLWTIGFMHVFGLSFNLANVWGLPLLIGTGAEYGINVMLRYREQLGNGSTTLPRSTVLAVLLNGLTTMAGFGGLMVARHQGIFGLGLILTVGALASLVSALVVLPVLLRLLVPATSARRQAIPAPG
jgi:hopanoid biosynthesis associated RND transporter like protein HpnN